MEVSQIAQFLGDTLNPDANVVRAATEALDRLSILPDFAFALLHVSAGFENQDVRVAAATYLKNLTTKHIESDGPSSKVSKEFKDQLTQALFLAEHRVLKVLVEVFRIIAVADFVKQNSWPELVPDLRSAIQNSNFINGDADCKWKTLNVLTILQAICRPFQYFLNPKVAKEPVPPQLELIAKEILVPLLAEFHQLVKKTLADLAGREIEIDKILLVVCKCMYFAVRSYMPSALVPLLPSFCNDLIGILHSLTLDNPNALEDVYAIQLKTGKRSLLIFCALITRHRKYSDKLMPHIINCVLTIVKHGKRTSGLDFLSERLISLAFDVISHVLETSLGWKLVSPHFSPLLDSAIFPALVMNEKDVSEWQEDPDEYIRKNLPSDLEDISGWREDLFTTRKSAINLLGVLSVSKGPPSGTFSSSSSASSKRKKSEKHKSSRRCSMGELVVLPFLSKFPFPSEANASQPRVLNDYFGVLMAYGGLHDFLREQKTEYNAMLIRTRLLPLYTASVCMPFLISTANWVLGELVSCLPEDMSAEIYSSLVKALALQDMDEVSCYPVRVSAAGAIAQLLENDYLPPEWLPLLQVLINGINGISKEDEESSILYQLLSSVVEAGNGDVAIHIPYIVSSLVGVVSNRIPADMEPWPQVVERGFAALSVMAKSWENFQPEELEKNNSRDERLSGQTTMSRAFSSLLQQAWLAPRHSLEPSKDQEDLLSPSCIDESSTLLRFMMQSLAGKNEILELKLPELLSVWAVLLSGWHAWEESADLAVFDCIKEVVILHTNYGLNYFLARPMPSAPAPPVPQQSMVESIGAFICEAICKYPSATSRACSCVHAVLLVPSYSSEAECVRQSLSVAFSGAAVKRLKELRSKPSLLQKTLLLVISSSYLCYPDGIEELLENFEDGGFAIWASALCQVCTSSSEAAFSDSESEMKLIVLALAKVVERMVGLRKARDGLLLECFSSLMEASVVLREMQEENEKEEEDEGEDDDEDEEAESEDYDEDSESEEREETEEEFLDRYAKAALDLENGNNVEERDVEDYDREIELGCLEEVDPQSVVLSLLQKYHHVLIPATCLPLQLTSNFLNSFPDCSVFFQSSG